MTLLRHPLLRFALYAAGSVVAALALAGLTGFHDLQLPVTALFIGCAAWLARVRTVGGALSALGIAVACYMGLFVLPLFLLLHGSFNPIANRHLADEALRIAAIFALPVLAGAGISSYLSRPGGHT